MSLMTKVKKVNLEGVEYIATVDMVTIQYFKDKTGKSFLKSVTNMTDLDEDFLFPMIGGMLRLQDDVKTPVGVEHLGQYDPFALIGFFTPIIVDLLSDSMPKGTPKGKPSKKK